jgi:hypothetical protein
VSDDEEKKQRPNANYRLSNENANPEGFTFYYSRERRLAKAPQAVRDLYNEEPPKRGGPLRVLLNSKPKVMMFASIVILCVAILFLSTFGYIGSAYELDGNKLAVQAVKYEGAVIVAVRKTINKNFINRFSSPYTGAVSVAVTAPDILPEDAFHHRIFFTLESNEQYRFSVPFDSDELTFFFQTEKKTLKMTIKPE